MACVGGGGGWGAGRVNWGTVDEGYENDAGSAMFDICTRGLGGSLKALIIARATGESTHEYLVLRVMG